MKRRARVVVTAVIFSVALVTGVPAGSAGDRDPDAVARRSDVYCTGFIADSAPRIDLQVVGGEKETIRYSFAEGDVVYLNKGRNAGVLPGAVFYILRPLGDVKHPFTHKRLGHYVREIGMLRVIETHNLTSTAQVTVSCDTVELGDLLKPYEAYSAPSPGDPAPLPRFSEGAGGTVGQIVMSPRNAEYLAANQVVYIDLGSRQGIRPGDNFTIYRHIGKSERVATMPSDDIVQQRSGGFGSDHYRGGDFSNSSTRVRRSEVLRHRPELPRKVLGHLVVLKVEAGTAVALITRTTEEVNIGDFIERVN